jgi:hypothetical protein
MAEAMLDCVVCSTRKWRDLDLAKAGELRAAGAVLLSCELCRRETYWKASDHGRRAGSERRSHSEPVNPAAFERVLGSDRVTMQAPLDKDMYRKAAAGMLEEDRRTGDERRQAFQRGHDRVPLRLPIRVRVNGKGAHFEEQTLTLNVSRHGVYFRSRMPYEKGIAAYLVLNYSPMNPASNIEQPATVVRVESPSGDGTRGIGVLIQEPSPRVQKTAW